MTDAPTWPKKVKMYIHGDKEYNWGLGEELGLSESAIKENFKYALYELTVEVSVNEDGTYEILGVEE